MMLDKEKIKNLIQVRFPSPKLVADTNVFRTEEMYHQNTFAVFYFDYADTLWKDTIDLKRYQDNLLSKDYYTSSGSLQWNFYLVFVLSRESYQQLSLEKKQSVEKNKIYTRKFILPENELLDFLSFPTPDETVLEKSVDPTDRWIKRLNHAGLGEIFSKKAKPEVLSNFYLGSVQTLPEVAPALSTSLTVDTGHIEELVIDSYREYPNELRYGFGKVNLIKGPNGTGKTSLLEAIELWHCGNTLRNKSLDHKEYRLKVKLRGRKDYIDYDAENPSLYRERDLRWYGRSTQGPSLVHQSFNRFNYFNTDFAYQLATDKSVQNIEAAFAALALGDQANYVSKRLDTFHEAFLSEKKDAEKQTKRIEAELGILNEKKRRLQKVESRSAGLFVQLKTLLGNEKFSNEFETIQDYRDHMHEDLVGVSHVVNETLKNMDWMEVVNVESIELSLKNLDEKLTKLNLIEENLKSLDVKLRAARRNHEVLEKRTRTLRGAKVYFDNPESLTLMDIEQKNRQIEIQQSLVSSILEAGKEIDISILLDSDRSKNLEQRINDQTKVINDLEQVVVDEERAILRLQESMNQIVAIVSEIKSLGKLFLEHEQNSQECPLCNSSLDHNELVKRIGSTGKLLESAPDFTNRKNYLIKLRDDIRKLKYLREHLKKATDLCGRFETISIESVYTIEGVTKGLKEVLVKKEELDKALEKNRTIVAECEKINLSERSLRLLKEDLANADLSVSLNTENTEVFLSLLTNYESQFEFSRNQIHVLEVESSDIKKSFDGLVEEIFGKVIPENPKAVLSRRVEAVRYVKSQIDKLKVTPDEKEDFFKLSSRVSSIIQYGDELLRVFSAEQRDSIELGSANESIDRFSKELEDVQKHLEKTIQALNVIEDIKQNDSKEKALVDFLDEHLSLITAIFKKIHAPQEFVGVNPKDLTLTRGNGETASLSSISTGQRSAFALSVFFSLNSSLQNAPPVVLIDDPVAYVDDLNTLSFLDYLRDLALKKDRQIFFATANDKLASLFERKFNFLGQDFKCLTLSRNK